MPPGGPGGFQFHGVGGGSVKTAKRPAIAAHRGNRKLQAIWRLSIHRNNITDSFMSPGDERRQPRLDGKLREIFLVTNGVCHI